MSHARTEDFSKRDAPAEQQDGADKAVAEKVVADKRASDHRDQIRSMAHAAVQAMVTSNRNK